MTIPAAHLSAATSVALLFSLTVLDVTVSANPGLFLGTIENLILNSASVVKASEKILKVLGLQLKKLLALVTNCNKIVTI